MRIAWNIFSLLKLSVFLNTVIWTNLTSNVCILITSLQYFLLIQFQHLIEADREKEVKPELTLGEIRRIYAATAPFRGKWRNNWLCDVTITGSRQHFDHYDVNHQICFKKSIFGQNYKSKSLLWDRLVWKGRTEELKIMFKSTNFR